MGHSGKPAGGKGGDDKKEDKKGLAQIDSQNDKEADCNPCY